MRTFPNHNVCLLVYQLNEWSQIQPLSFYYNPHIAELSPKFLVSLKCHCIFPRVVSCFGNVRNLFVQTIILFMNNASTSMISSDRHEWKTNEIVFQVGIHPEAYWRHTRDHKMAAEWPRMDQSWSPVPCSIMFYFEHLRRKQRLSDRTVRFHYLALIITTDFSLAFFHPDLLSDRVEKKCADFFVEGYIHWVQSSEEGADKVVVRALISIKVEAGGHAYHNLVRGQKCPVSDIRSMHMKTRVHLYLLLGFYCICCMHNSGMLMIKAKSRRKQLRHSWRGSLYYAPTNATLLQSLPVQSPVSYTYPALHVHPAHQQCKANCSGTPSHSTYSRWV